MSLPIGRHLEPSLDCCLRRLPLYRGGQGIDLEKDGQLMEEVVAEYAQTRMEWCDKTGRLLPTDDEIAKVIRERKRNYG